VLQVPLPDRLMSAHEILEFVLDANCYPNVSIAYRILLTVPVTVASAERSFSKLKLTKNYLRSTMSQERLNGLAICSIERNILDTIDLDTIINDFASRNARRHFFCESAQDVFGCFFFIKIRCNNINTKNFYISLLFDLRFGVYSFIKYIPILL
jgi:hypothetical protein